MGTVRVTKKVVYDDKQPTDDEITQGVQYVPGGQLRIPSRPEDEIADTKLRQKSPPGHGEIRITVVPGDELGQLSFDIQFQGKGEHEFCLQQLDAQYQNVSEWLGQILAELPADFEAEIEATCPPPDIRVQLHAGAQRLAGHALREKTVRRSGVRDVTQSVRRGGR